MSSPVPPPERVGQIVRSSSGWRDTLERRVEFLTVMKRRRRRSKIDLMSILPKQYAYISHDLGS